jgi:uncharacterized protein YabE (DUF348 family)
MPATYLDIAIGQFAADEFEAVEAPSLRFCNQRVREACGSPIGVFSMRRSVKYGLYGAVLAAIVGGSAALATAAAEPAITLVVDGNKSTIHSTAHTVGAVLADAGYHVDGHDIVAPAVAQPMSAGGTIVLKRGRELHLAVDGKKKNVWTTEPTVADALADLGYPVTDFVSVSRSSRLALTPTTLSLRAPKHVVVQWDGHTRSVTTTALTAGDLVHQLGIKVRKQDVVLPGRGKYLTNRMHVRIERVSSKRMTMREAVSFPVIKKSDPSMYTDQVTVLTAGTPGSADNTYNVLFADGVQVGRTLLSSHLLSAAKAQVEKVGTKLRPVSTSGLNWDAVAACESGGNWAINTGNGYYGGLQFSESTWLSNGGGQYAQYPSEASRAQQIAVANRLYAARGSSPWPVCGANL